jgi:uncharacterized protein YkwD
MRRIRGIVGVTWLALAAAACGVGGVEDDEGGDDDDDQGEPIEGEPAALAGITAAHNAVRAEVGVAPLRWNEELEALAVGFIADCEFAHSSQGERSDVAGFAYVGENLYASGGFVPSGADVSDAWASEAAAYTHATNSCSDVCGHYTQQVWSTTTDLGCALKACDGGAIVSCEYGPGGNDGGPPY